MQYGTYLTNSYIYLNLISKIILSLVMIYIAFFHKNIKNTWNNSKSMLQYFVVDYI